MTICASSTSTCCSASSTRSSCSRTRSMPPSAASSSCESCSWKWTRWRSGTATELPELARDVLLGALVAGLREDLARVVVLHEAADAPALRGVEVHREERRAVGDARRLLHVVRDDDDRVELLEPQHEVLDRAR